MERKPGASGGEAEPVDDGSAEVRSGMSVHWNKERVRQMRVGRVVVGTSTDNQELFELLKRTHTPFVATASASVYQPELSIDGYMLRGMDEIQQHLEPEPPEE